MNACTKSTCSCNGGGNSVRSEFQCCWETERNDHGEAKEGGRTLLDTSHGFTNCSKTSNTSSFTVEADGPDYHQNH